MKNNIVAMVLAGGRGTRLEALTENVAKPAVHFGGKYRIIDFVLSNCVNSGINKVGVLTQYESVSLGTYIGTGQKWGLDTKESFTTILPARQTISSGDDWYLGTANAIYQNLDYLKENNADYVVILSGDHIYKMDYSLMLEEHIKKQADVSIAVLNVGLQEASRFGILHVDSNNMITDFVEKPKVPKSTLASMGIYIFNIDTLKEYLSRDALNVSSNHDFGMDIIPLLLEENKRLFAYEFNGYWKDVGTIESLWQANMDLLNDESLDLYNQKQQWKIYSEDHHIRPQYLGLNARVSNSIVGKGCYIDGIVKNSVIFDNVSIDKDVVIENSVIMPGAIIKNHSVITHSIVATNEILDCVKQVDDTQICLIASSVPVLV